MNFLLRKNKSNLPKKFFSENNKFIRIAAGITVGLMISGIYYAFPPVANIVAPTINNYSENSYKSFSNDVTTIRRDIDYLVEASDYSTIQNEFSQKTIEINNSRLTLHEYPQLELNITFGKANPISSNVFNRSFSPNFSGIHSSTFPFIGGALRDRLTQEEIATRLNIPDSNSILGYSKIDSNQLKGSSEFSFSATLSGTMGECFLLFHKVERVEMRYDTAGVMEQYLSSGDPQSERVCITQTIYDQYFPNKISFKETNLDKVSSIELWLVPSDSTKADIKTNGSESNTFFFNISNERFIGFNKSYDKLITDTRLFCLEGFHKGAPDSIYHMMEHDSTLWPDPCPIFSKDPPSTKQLNPQQ